MTTVHLLSTAWEWQPSIVAGCAALASAYVGALRFRFTWRSILYFGGVLWLLLATMSPIDTLGETYLVSAHMLQHFILVMIVPPLLVLGIPAKLAARVLAVPQVARVERVLRKAPVAWGAGIGAIILWHLPAVFNRGLEHAGVHIAQHLCFLVTATIFWWPVLGPLEDRRMHPVLAVPYLFTACLVSTAIGVIITFAPEILYARYANPTDTLGALSLIRNGWGLSAATDQQIAGLIMWVPCCLIYIAVMLIGLGRWYASQEVEPAQQAGSLDAA